MERDSNKPENGGPSGNGLVLLMTLLAGALLVRQVPLTDSRPPTVEPKTFSYIAADVDARLWQDPIGAVARGIGDEEQRAGKYPNMTKADHSAARIAQEISRHMRDDVAQPPIFVGVLVPGGAYPGSAEWRRKARYAVLSGLKESGFAPSDPEHLAYFTADSTVGAALYSDRDVKRAPASQFFPYEWFDQVSVPSTISDVPTASSDFKAGGRRLLLIWLDQDTFSDKTVERMDQLFVYLLGTQSKAESANCKDRVAPTRAPTRRPRVIILGPGDSTTLKNMATDAASPGACPPLTDLQFYDYGATARDADLLPAAYATSKSVNLHDYFANQNVSVFRAVGDDQQLACALRDELALRGISAPMQVPKRKDGGTLTPHSPEVVLIAEWDTDYGRTLSGIMKSTLAGTTRCSVDGNKTDVAASRNAQAWSSQYWLDSFTYLRGLDGRIPGRQAEGNGPGSGSAGGRTEEKEQSTGSVGDDKRIERAEGQAQLDYLRRLALRLHAMDMKARDEGQRGILAIGVLGSDVYDKLIVLQAMRPAFPNAVFFTTDLDARMLHPVELDWTRNVLVASSFGFELTSELQSGIPPFRDSYQTSLFLSTLIALHNVNGKSCTTGSAIGDGRCAVDQSRIDRWRAQTRMFEIGRHGPFDLSRGADGRYLGIAAAAAAADPGKDCRAMGDLYTCTSVHPQTRALATKPSAFAWQISFLVLTLGLIALALARGAGKRISDWTVGPDARPGAKIPVAKKAWLIAAGVGGIAMLLLVSNALPTLIERIANYLTQDGQGAPMTLLEGVSIWPTELIRTFELILAVLLIHRGWRNLDKNLDYVSEQMHWTQQRKALEEDVRKEYESWNTWQRFLHMFSFRLNWHGTMETRREGMGTTAGTESDRIDTETGLRPKAEEFWRKYIYQGRISARLCRIVVAIALYFMFAIAVSAIFGFPENAIRGDRAKVIDKVLVLTAVFATQFLIFFVVDATLLCLQFVTAISRRRWSPEDPRGDDFDIVSITTRWPVQTLEHFARKLNIDQRYVDQWVTIHVIGLRTKAVSQLIFYPYILLSLLIIARSSVFDNWAMPVALIIILTVSVLIVTICAILLRSASEYARGKAIWRLNNERIRLNSGNAADERLARQVELMIAQIGKYNTGSFASYLEQPLMRAILLPLGSFGGAGLLQYLTIWNF